MLRMQAFHKLLSSTSRRTDSYFKALNLLTKANRDEISALESDLSWQEWGEQNQEAVST